MSKEKKSEGQEQFQLTALLALGGLLLLGAFWNKHGYQIMHFWKVYHWRIYIFIIGVLIIALAMGAVRIWELYGNWMAEKEITGFSERAVYLGKDEDGEDVYLQEEFRIGHAQVIGTTNAGKTESVILPWIIQDINNGSGVLIIDGKSDKSFLDKLYAYTVQANRAKDFRLFSIADPDHSSTINPLAEGSPQEVAERVFASFSFENEYYRNVQYKIFLALITLIHERQKIPTFKLVHQLLTDMEELDKWIEICDDEALKKQLQLFHDESPESRSTKISGLDAKLSQFSMGALSPLFNAEQPNLDIDQALRENLICYFQLPTMYFAELSKATGKLVLQSLQSSVAKRHLGINKKPSFFSVFLDDFQDYVSENFASLLNKSRSANVGIVFSHQAMGDLRKVSPAFAEIVATNTNLKVVMRSNDPETSDYLAKTFGTRTTEKVTERRVKGVLGETNTGEGSFRETEEYEYHPNRIRKLERGQGVVAIPHPYGVKLCLIRFKMRPDLPASKLPRIFKESIKTSKPLNQGTSGELPVKEEIKKEESHEQ